MITWAVTSTTRSATGEADTLALAVDEAFDAAADMVRAGERSPIALTIGGKDTHVYPQTPDAGDAQDVADTLAAMDDLQAAVRDNVIAP
jgi:hypothetical protein